MSKLDDLLQTLCPNGVERVQVKKAFQRLRGTPITAGKMKEIEDPTGEIRIFAGGKTIINSKEKDIPNANITRVPAVLIQSRGVIDVVYYDKPFTFKNEMWAYTTENKTTVKYLYYVLKNNVQSFRDAASGMGSLPQISLPVTEDFYIPLPPLAVQQEIVRILDSFTELTTELNEKLTAELTARRKQYEHYRDELLSSNAPRWGNKVIQRRLSEVADISTGSSNTDDAIENGLYPFYVRSQEPLAKNEYEFDEEAIITAGDGVGVGKVFHYVKGKFALHQRAYRIHPTADTLNGRFLYHYFIAKFPAYIGKQMYQGSVPSIRRPMLNNFEVLIPPIEVQQQIVDILDRFDLICSDLTSGLPAEIAARQKQYEYYRDKLLTFKELDT